MLPGPYRRRRSALSLARSGHRADNAPNLVRSSPSVSTAGLRATKRWHVLETPTPAAEPENSKKMRLTRMVRPTLNTMLTTIQKRHPLPAQPLPPPPNTIIPDASPSLRLSSVVPLTYPSRLSSLLMPSSLPPLGVLAHPPPIQRDRRVGV